MKITAQEEYGLRCLLRVAKAESGSATLPEVASAEGLSIPYVAKLMGVLRQHGIIESVRGRSGGYKLARPSREIGLGSLLLTLGEPLFEEEAYCHKHAGTEAPDGICLHQQHCTLKSLWQTLESWIRHTLDQITLADLIACSDASIATLLRQRLAGATPLPDLPPLIPLNVLTK
jgi:Rrf2 family protein